MNRLVFILYIDLCVYNNAKGCVYLQMSASYFVKTYLRFTLILQRAVWWQIVYELFKKWNTIGLGQSLLLTATNLGKIVK